MTTSRLRILLVEDDEDDYILTRDLLNEADPSGYELIWSPTFDDGLSQLARRKFDACLVDYQLGAKDGVAWLRMARIADWDGPAILLTGLHDERVDAAALRAGASDYLVKPRLTAALLSRALRYAIRHAEAMDALKLSEQRYELAAQGSNDGIWDWNLRSGEVFFSTRWKEILGYPEDQIGVGISEWFDRVHDDDRVLLEQAVERHRIGELHQLACEHRLRTRDGKWLWVLGRGRAVYGTDGRAERMAGSLTDISERKATELRLAHEAMHDPLTGLPNRSLFHDRVSHTLFRAQRNDGLQWALLYFDLDGFKGVNDSLGHVVGDRLLVSMARRLRAELRQSDTVARLGGDEFALLVEGFDAEADLEVLATKIRELISKPVRIDDQTITVTTSIGIALGHAEYPEPEAIIRDADTAMYAAKQAGRDQHVLFNASMHQDALQQFNVVSDLREALEEPLGDQLDLYYQPIVALRDNSIRGAEALLRWQHPRCGAVSPEEFIPLAEEQGLIRRLTRQVFARAAGDVRSFNPAENAPAPYVSINLSPQDLADDQFLQTAEELLAKTALPASRMYLELTERSLLGQSGDVEERLDALKALGFGLMIDDFGTGYSALSYLHQYPFDVLKIDRRFVRELQHQKRNQAIVRSILALAENLGLKVIAEGVESRQAANLLREFGCDFAQGFYFAKALPRDEFTAVLRRGLALN